MGAGRRADRRRGDGDRQFVRGHGRVPGEAGSLDDTPLFDEDLATACHQELGAALLAINLRLIGHAVLRWLRSPDHGSTTGTGRSEEHTYELQSLKRT